MSNILYSIKVKSHLRYQTLRYYKMISKKKTISCIFINLMENIQEYNVRKKQ